MRAQTANFGRLGQHDPADLIAAWFGASLDASRPDARMALRRGDEGVDAAMAAHIEAIAARADRAAFEALFLHFAPRVKAYLLKLGGDPAGAEELAQETMVTVWRKAALYDPLKATPATWIFAIARNRRIDAFRRERRPEIDPDDPALRIDPEPAADAAVETQQASAEMVAALDRLSEDERRLLTLAYYEDKSQSRIAAELGIPLGTVKSRTRQVFAKLRARLSGPQGERP